MLTQEAKNLLANVQGRKEKRIDFFKRMQEEQEQAEKQRKDYQESSVVRDLSPEAFNSLLAISAPTPLTDKYNRYIELDKTMYNEEGKDYDTEYNEYNTQKQEYVKPYGNLSKMWQSAGGAVKLDAQGNYVLDIEKQNELAKEDKTIPDATTLLRMVTPKGGYNKEDASIYYEISNELQETEGGTPEDLRVIDTSYLSPDERRELVKYQQELARKGIIGQNIVAYNKEKKDLEDYEENSTLKGLGRGVVKMLDFVGSLVNASSEARRKETELITGRELPSVSPLALTQIYDKYFGTLEPRTARGRIIENIGSFLVMPGAGGIAKAITGAIGASVGQETAEQLYDWATLDTEQKAEQLKKNAPLQRAVVGLVGAVFGDVGVSKLGSLVKDTLKKKPDLETTEELQKSFTASAKYEKGKTEFEEKLFDEQRKDLINELKEELYKPEGIIKSTSGLKQKTVEDLRTAQLLFQRSVKSRDQEKIGELLGNTLAEENTVKELPFTPREPEAVSQNLARFLAKNKGQVRTRDLDTLINEEAVKPFKEKIKQEIEEASKQYENSVKEIQNVNVDAQKIIALVKENTKGAVNTLDQEKIIQHYGEQLSEVQNISDLIKVNRELNKDLGRVRDDSLRYTLNQVKSSVNKYIKDEASIVSDNTLFANQAQSFQKLLEANKVYGEAREEVVKDRDILDALQEGKDRYRQPENRIIESGSVALKGYRKLTPEQKERLLNSLPEGNASIFRAVSLDDVKSGRFGEYSDLELRTMFNKENYATAKEYAEQLADKRLTKTEVLTQAIDAYRSNELTTTELQQVGKRITEGVEEKTSKEIESILNNVVKEEEIFREAKFMKYMREDNPQKMADAITRSEDLDTLATLEKNLAQTYGKDSKATSVVNDYLQNVKDVIKQKKKQELEELLSTIETEDIPLKDTINQVTELRDYITKNREFYTKLYDNNVNIRDNLACLNDRVLPKVMEDLEKIPQIVRENAEKNPEFAKFMQLKEDYLKKIEKQKSGLRTDYMAATPDNLLAIAVGEMLHSFVWGMGARVAIKSLRRILNRMTNKNFEKLQNDPSYFAKQLKLYRKAVNETTETEKQLFTVLLRRLPALVV